MIDGVRVKKFKKSSEQKDAKCQAIYCHQRLSVLHQVQSTMTCKMIVVEEQWLGTSALDGAHGR